MIELLIDGQIASSLAMLMAWWECDFKLVISTDHLTLSYESTLAGSLATRLI